MVGRCRSCLETTRLQTIQNLNPKPKTLNRMNMAWEILQVIQEKCSQGTPDISDLTQTTCHSGPKSKKRSCSRTSTLSPTPLALEPKICHEPCPRKLGQPFLRIHETCQPVLAAVRVQIVQLRMRSYHEKGSLT